MMMDLDMDEDFDADVSDAADWDVHKENVQPRKEGRRFRRMLNAIHNNLCETPLLLEERRRFELQLLVARSGDVFNELETWHRYVVWCEESFPRGSAVESGLLGVLERALSRMFGLIRRMEGDAANQDELLNPEPSSVETAKRSKADAVKGSTAERLRNSERLVDLFVKLARFFQREPHEVFKFMQNNRIGERCTLFYSTWATQYEANDDLKSASAVLQAGISVCSIAGVPVDNLGTQRKRIETRVAEHVAREMQQGAPFRTPANGADRRQFANELVARPGPRGAALAPTIRVGDALVQSTPRNPPLGNNSAQRGALQQRVGLTTASATASLRRNGRVQTANRENDISVMEDGVARAPEAEDRRAFLPPVFDARYGAWSTLPRAAQLQRENTPASHANWRSAALDDAPLAPSISDTPFEIFEEDENESDADATTNSLMASFQQAPGVNHASFSDADLDVSAGILLAPTGSFATPFRPTKTVFRTPRSLASTGLRVRKAPGAKESTTSTALFSEREPDAEGDTATHTLNNIAEHAERKSKRKQPANINQKDAKLNNNKLPPKTSENERYMQPSELLKSMMHFGEEEEFRMEFSVEELRAFQLEEAERDRRTAGDA